MTKKNLLNLAPEIYLIIATLYYWTLTANVFNIFAIVLLSILMFQVMTKKALSGILIASIFVLINLYMVLALISELSEFEVLASGFYQLLIVGSLFLLLNLSAGGFMFWKYFKTYIPSDSLSSKS
ncbi:hypothetical protein EAX61_03665 [Dokdonia sinensis]|uniref:Uncharacterized protein n=1 Tax=Dokdonia sinensis TaxID=2479847 RepID=A0A3M0GF03_9FLAO|nr:hypothetical protein [Dokdonia sinensis]RMB63495.1 hypothetical protein EAX61_03665 [Dokdonia sinensis]